MLSIAIFFAGISYVYFPNVKTTKWSEFRIIIHFLLEVDHVYMPALQAPASLANQSRRENGRSTTWQASILSPGQQAILLMGFCIL